MEDLGAPSSYLELGKGAECFSCDGEKVGKVEHVLAIPEDDIFDGIVLDTSVLPGGHRFVDAEQVEEIFDRGVPALRTAKQTSRPGTRRPQS